MLDKRIFTFLELCDVMNYHKTAVNLLMTQPAVTQHIKYLENNYDCKLFEYSNRQLTKTAKCIELEKLARSLVSLSSFIDDTMTKKEKIKLNIGATKTIGEYLLDDILFPLLYSEEYEINIIIDNTEKLLERLNHFELDLLLLEGFVEKEKYQCQKISDEHLTGICSPSHKFAGKEVSLTDILDENIVLREKGSGTRAVFESYLNTNGYSTEIFKNKSIVSSNSLIEKIVAENMAISFVYSIIPAKNKKIATFKIKDSNLSHEFQFVFLNKTRAEKIINLLTNK